MDELPCRLDSVISFRFDFDNLQKFLEHLDTKNKRNQSQINDLSQKLVEFGKIKEEIRDTNIRIDGVIGRADELNVTLVYHSNKLMEVEKVHVGFENVSLPSLSRLEDKRAGKGFHAV